MRQAKTRNRLLTLVLFWLPNACMTGAEAVATPPADRGPAPERRQPPERMLTATLAASDAEVLPPPTGGSEAGPLAALVPGLLAVGYTPAALEGMFNRDHHLETRLAHAAKRIGGFGASAREAQRRHGKCLWGVAKALEVAKGEALDFYQLLTDAGRPAVYGKHRPGESAGAMLRWASENPDALCRAFGLAKVETIAEGAILFYRPGRCGFSQRYGHVEIVVSNTVGCSDHCKPLNKACGPDLVVAPVYSCVRLAPAASGVGPAVAADGLRAF